MPLFFLLPTGGDVLLLLYISLLGSAASYGVFFYNASRGNLTALSSLTFLTPMFAAAGGYVALGETLTPLQLAGATVTLGAVALINKQPDSQPQKGGGGGGAKPE
jgi:drug/metabolite transporter (DMT)-like permease